jgi:hypothetical protein
VLGIAQSMAAHINGYTGVDACQHACEEAIEVATQFKEVWYMKKNAKAYTHNSKVLKPLLRSLVSLLGRNDMNVKRMTHQMNCCQSNMVVVV